jgi:hypothetical protein
MQGDYETNMRSIRERQMIALNLQPEFSVEANHPTPKPYTINAEDTIHNGPQEAPLRQEPHETLGSCSTCGGEVSMFCTMCCMKCLRTGGHTHEQHCPYFVAAQVAIDELDPEIEPEQVQDVLGDPEETYHDDFPDPDISPTMPFVSNAEAPAAAQEDEGGGFVDSSSEEILESDEDVNDTASGIERIHINGDGGGTA